MVLLDSESGVDTVGSFLGFFTANAIFLIWASAVWETCIFNPCNMCSSCYLHVFVNSPSSLVSALHLFILRQQMLEEGEVLLFQYQQAENISDVETNLLHDFVNSGFFLLDENDNLEDDSSETEDLNMERRYACNSFLH